MVERERVIRVDSRPMQGRRRGRGGDEDHGVNSRSLSQSRTRLVRLMQRLRFGRIEDLWIQQGEPVWTPAPRAIRSIRLGRVHRGVRRSGTRNFHVKKPLVELFALFDHEQSLVISELEFQDGLPFRIGIIENVEQY